ncbi:MAG: A24 family peptidase [Nanoarchaeota archaeon]
MLETIFLIVLGFVWILFAVIQDLKKREIANWINFSLIIFALIFRFFYSLFNNSGYSLFYQGLIGFGVFFILGNLLYYGKVFAGGDAKLMIALGAVIPFSESLFANLNLSIIFFLFFLFFGALYGIIFSVVLGMKNKKTFAKEFSKQFKEKKKLVYASLIAGTIIIFFAFFENILFYMAILVFISPYIYLSAKAIDESCMIKKMNPKKLSEGDWLYKDIKVGRKLIKARWDGLSKEEIILLRKKKKIVLIRQGIPFSPVFLVSYAVLIYMLINQKVYLF